MLSEDFSGWGPSSRRNSSFVYGPGAEFQPLEDQAGYRLPGRWPAPEEKILDPGPSVAFVYRGLVQAGPGVG